MYITFDGTDFAGKSTVIELLIERLNKEDVKAVSFNEPGTGAFGQHIRQTVLSEGGRSLNRLTSALLFTAAYNESIDKFIKPALDDGYIVLGDRSNVSTYAYQYKLKKEQLESIISLTRNQLKPDLSFCLVTSYSVFKERMELGRETNAWDSKPKVEHDALVQRFSEYCYKNPENSFLVSTDKQTPEEVADFIYQQILRLVVSKNLY